MTGEDLVNALGAKLPRQLAGQLVEQYVTLRQDVATQTLGRATPGKFVEAVVKVLQHLDPGTVKRGQQVDQYLANLECKATKLDEHLKVCLPRVCRSIYTLRNKRSIAHLGSVDPSFVDLKYLLGACQWVLSELIRHVLGTDMDAAGRLVEYIESPIHSLIEDFGDRRLVFGGGSAVEELLLLLRSYHPDWVPVRTIHTSMSRRRKSDVSNAIRQCWGAKWIEGEPRKQYKITQEGLRRTAEILKATVQ